jgi:chemotaxis signal transduction protein
MNPASDLNAKPRRARHTERVILFFVSSQLFAISAAAVREIRSTDSLAGGAVEIESGELSKVRHVVERGHEIYFVVNACLHFGLPVTRPALVLILRQSRVAVLVDRIERMEEISAIYALPRAFEGDERRWYRGLAYLEDTVIPVLNPEGFLRPEESQRLDLLASRAFAQTELQGAVEE